MGEQKQLKGSGASTSLTSLHLSCIFIVEKKEINSVRRNRDLVLLVA